MIAMLLCLLVQPVHADTAVGLCKPNEGRCKGYQIAINGVCRDVPCKDGHYLKDNYCYRCPQSCRTCLTRDVCNRCTGARVLVDGKCLWRCPRKFIPVITDISNIRICIPKKQSDHRNTCQVGQWTAWSDCGTISAPNLRTRTRSVAVTSSKSVTSECVGIAPIQHRYCLSLSSLEDTEGCAVSEWMPWGACDEQCSNKYRKRRRIIESPPGPTRRKRSVCPNLVEREPCPCYLKNIANHGATKCEMGDWSSWSGCDAVCGTGSQTRTREPVAQHSSQHYCRSYTESKPCCKQACRDYCSDTLLGEWSKWSRCQGTCQRSIKRRVRKNLFSTVLLFCDMDLTIEEKGCQKKECHGQAPCEITEWGEWSACDVNNTKFRTRAIISGSNCPELVDSIPCGG